MTIRQRRKKLEEMTQGNGLSDAYTATLTRLKAQKGNKSILGLKVLMWVLYSERPLKTEELRHALGVELESTDLDHENIPALQTLLASSLGLVMVEASSSTFRLVHFTLQEHLLSDPTLFHRPHSIIAEVSLTYLNFQCVRDLSPALDSAPTTMPLLEYAYFYWGEHTRKGMTEDVKILALRLLNKFDEHISARLLLLRHIPTSDHYHYFDCKEGPIGFTGLHGTAFLGIVEILEALLEMKEWDVNARDNASCTPLLWAAIRGHEEVVKILLERRDIYPDLKDSRRYQTPLQWAATKGHEGVVKVLLERKGVNPDQTSSVYGPIALYFAAAYGQERIVKMLSEREDVNPNQIATGTSCTALSIAAWTGYERVVKILLEREDVNPNIAYTDDGRTPLSNAAMWGYEGIVKMLLDRNDIRIDTRDRKNKTALSWALSEGHDKIAKMILERAGIKSDIADPGNQESLPSSARDGEESVAEIELRDDHSNATTANPSVEPTSPPADSHVPEAVPDCEYSFPDSTDSIIPSTKLSCPPQPPSPGPLEPRHSRRQTAAHPDNTPSTVSIAPNKNFITASFICILAFLLYVFSFSLPGIFSLL